MLRQPLFVLLLIFACGSSPVMGATDLDRFAGQWRGVAVDRNDGFEITADSLVLQLKQGTEGFDLEWKIPDSGDQARFIETDQPGVFSTSASKLGFLGLFSSSKEIDPLAGDPLIWARFEAGSLTVYKLTIDDLGAFSLDRSHLTVAGESLQLRFTRRAHGEPERSFVALLERVGATH
ncbi:MAG: hypothetical protein U9Q71_05105 [Pseudomonadota bacterium]|nr:hypothetical protein [Pseudomonadota bacterium]